MQVAILLLAAGRGTRLGSALPKAYLTLGDRPLVAHAASRLIAAVDPAVRLELVLVAHPDDAALAEACRPALLVQLGRRGELRIASGGATRQQSMRNGLQATSDAVGLVIVHDAARPLPPIDAVRNCLAAAAAHGAALLAVPLADTLKRVAEGEVQATLDRSSLWLAQTPQIVQRELLLRALAHADKTAFAATDDVSLVEHLGGKVAVVPGSPRNLKITQPEDLPLAAAILAGESHQESNRP